MSAVIDRAVNVRQLTIRDHADAETALPRATVTMDTNCAL